MDNTGMIKVELRTSCRKGDNNLLKRNGYLLGNIVGKGIPSTAIAIKKEEFRKAIKKAGRNSVFTLVIPDGKEYTVMTKEIHTEPLKNEITHIDFQNVSYSEKMKQDVVIKIIGTEHLEPKRLLINSVVDSILVEGLPQSIPDQIVVDVSDLEEGDSILFSDIKLTDGITANIEPGQKILTVVGSKTNSADSVDESEEEVSEGE